MQVTSFIAIDFSKGSLLAFYLFFLPTLFSERNPVVWKNWHECISVKPSRKKDIYISHTRHHF